MSNMRFNATELVQDDRYLVNHHTGGELFTSDQIPRLSRKRRFLYNIRSILFFAFILTRFCSIPSISAQSMKDSIDVPANSSLVLKAIGEGVQIYDCISQKWTLQAPDARLFDEQGHLIGRHYAGPTWELHDGSQVHANAVGKRASSDLASVPWLLLQSIRATGKLERVDFVQRTETHGGNAPQEACSEGRELRVPYTATYLFYSSSLP